MKVLKYKQYLIKEEVINSDVPTTVDKGQLISQLQKVLGELDTVETMGKDDLEEMLEMISESDELPVVVKKQMINTFKLMMVDEFRNEYRKILLYMIDRINNGLEPRDIGADKEVNDKMGNVTNLMSKILNISKEELEETTQKFFAGAKKYQDSKNASIKHTPEDPFGEEEWDDTSEEDRIKKAFESNNIVPNKIIDAFYERIKTKLENGHEKDDDVIKKELDRLISVNGKIPDKIKKLLK